MPRSTDTRQRPTDVLLGVEPVSTAVFEVPKRRRAGGTLVLRPSCAACFAHFWVPRARALRADERLYTEHMRPLGREMSPDDVRYLLDWKAWDTGFPSPDEALFARLTADAAWQRFLSLRTDLAVPDEEVVDFAQELGESLPASIFVAHLCRPDWFPDFDLDVWRAHLRVTQRLREGHLHTVPAGWDEYEDYRLFFLPHAVALADDFARPALALTAAMKSFGRLIRVLGLSNVFCPVCKRADATRPLSAAESRRMEGGRDFRPTHHCERDHATFCDRPAHEYPREREKLLLVHADADDASRSACRIHPGADDEFWAVLRETGWLPPDAEASMATLTSSRIAVEYCGWDSEGLLRRMARHRPEAVYFWDREAFFRMVLWWMHGDQLNADGWRGDVPPERPFPSPDDVWPWDPAWDQGATSPDKEWRVLVLGAMRDQLRRRGED